MRLLELFNSKIEGKVSKDTDAAYVVWADIGDDRIKFIAYNDFDKEDNPTDEWDVMFKAGDSYAFTNSGVAAQVLSFVKDCMTKFVEKRKPKQITFTANGSRVPVYAKMLQRFSSGYEIEQKGDHYAEFKLTLK